jgi:SAM-dependent methyltransferase
VSRAGRAGAQGLEGRFTYRQSEAQKLPFPDDTFDLTTCHTVLIHLPDPSAAIAEDNGADPAKIDGCVVNIKASADCAAVDASAKCG